MVTISKSITRSKRRTAPLLATKDGRESTAGCAGSSWTTVANITPLWTLLRGRAGRCGFCEPRAVNGNVQLNGSKFNNGTAVGPCCGHLEGHLYSRHVAVVGIVDLRRNCADRRVRIVQQPHQEA